jgi:hypothetical protein
MMGWTSIFWSRKYVFAEAYGWVESKYLDQKNPYIVSLPILWSNQKHQSLIPTLTLNPYKAIPKDIHSCSKHWLATHSKVSNSSKYGMRFNVWIWKFCFWLDLDMAWESMFGSGIYVLGYVEQPKYGLRVIFISNQWLSTHMYV